MGEQANGLDDFLFLQRNDATRPCSAGASSAGTRSACARANAAGNGNVGNAAQRRAAGCSGTARACSLSGGDQLQKFLWIVEPLLEFRAEGLGRELRRHRKFAGGRIGRDKLDFIDADRGILVFAESFLDLFREILRLGAAHGKGTHQAW